MATQSSGFSASRAAALAAKSLAIAALLGFYALFLAQKINFVTADLGRHLKNGEIILKNAAVPQTNLYSYSDPNFRIINHHWGTGVVFYLVWKLGGFKALSVFSIGLGLAAFLVFFLTAWQASSFEIAAFCAAIAIPCLGDRAEIRPELFSYLFCGIFLWILWRYRDDKAPERSLYVLPLLELLWVNLHIYFFLGFWLCGVFLLEAGWDYFRNRRSARRVKVLAWLLASLVLASLLNPRGIYGTAYPAFIFNNFGYRLFENQPVWFIEKLFRYPPAFYFKAAFALLCASWAASLLADHRGPALSEFLLGAFFSALAWLAVRNFSLFAYFAIPLAAANIGAAFKAWKAPKWMRAWFMPLGALAVVAMMRADPGYFALRWRRDLGLGLAPGVSGAADFFVKNGLRGPIMNNYDNGSYLIYYLYPAERVFVDNRPEAYPASFFNDVYVPMQRNEKKWKQAEARYGFNSIIFYWHDLTPWGQAFIINRVKDPAWAPVYADAYNVILLRRDAPANAAIIRRFEMRRSMFGVRTAGKKSS
ncbi:MAG: hypothetical protein ACYCPQ_00760 [Elusimicrobiota bacterium]